VQDKNAGQAYELRNFIFRFKNKLMEFYCINFIFEKFLKENKFKKINNKSKYIIIL